MRRFVCDLLADELRRLRPGRPSVSPPWPDDLRLATDLGVDSLEQLQLATALGQAIHLELAGIDDALNVRPTIGAWLDLVAASCAAYSARLTFKTSGTTGHPTWCTHDLADLRAEIAVVAELLGPRRRVIAAVPSHHIYGFLFTVLLPLLLGAEVLDLRSHAPARLVAAAGDGDLVVGHPEYWSAVVRGGPRLAPGIVGVSSTAPCPPATAAAARGCGIARFVEVYGSSETAGIGWRDDPAAAYALFPYWRHVTGTRELVRAGATGERRVTLPDDVHWDDARRLRPIGRPAGVVQVGGVNVWPQAVAAALLRRPGVAAAAVRLMNPHEGTRLKAFVVPTDPTAPTATLAAELWAWIDAELAPAERPKSIVFGPALPVGPLGKAADWFIDATVDEPLVR